MSMPSFPPNGADVTREEALTMIIASIAMEELALSHILNAEGEKLQYILGTLPGSAPRACPQEVLAVNKSVVSLVEAVTQNQILLKNKLDQVLAFCPPPPPPPCPPGPPPCPCPCPPDSCPPPCPAPDRAQPCGKGAIQLVGQREKFLWSPDCRLPWKQRFCTGSGVCWDGRAPAQIRLDPGRAYAVRYVLNVCAPSPARGALVLRQSPCGAFTDTLPLYFSIGHPGQGQQTLQCAFVLRPCAGGGYGAALSLALDARAALCVEQAVMDVAEL